MSNKLKDLMEKIVQEKKAKSARQTNQKRGAKRAEGEVRGAHKNKKQGGLFDK